MTERVQVRSYAYHSLRRVVHYVVKILEDRTTLVIAISSPPRSDSRYLDEHLALARTDIYNLLIHHVISSVMVLVLYTTDGPSNKNFQQFYSQNSLRWHAATTDDHQCKYWCIYTHIVTRMNSFVLWYSAMSLAFTGLTLWNVWQQVDGNYSSALSLVLRSKTYLLVRSGHSRAEFCHPL